MQKYILMLVCLAGAVITYAQNSISGTIIDAQTKEPLPGVTIRATNGNLGTVTDANGRFEIPESQTSDIFETNYAGFATQIIPSASNQTITLEADIHSLQSIVVTANREASQRTTAPVAISKLSARVLDETKPTNMYEALNKVSGVYMVNLNNEQHSMAIRQPFTTNAYFQYLEDGLPVRPMGVFNHNALIEMNIFAVSSIEVIKGPASSLYGPEAVGGAVNIITQKPTAVPTVRIGLQGDQFGYGRVQYGLGGMVNKKFGLYGGGFFARQRDSWQSRSDFDKQSFNGRAEYHFNPSLRLISTLSYNNYDSQTGGSIDSISFYNRSYSSSADFTYRRVYALRTRATVEKDWSNGSQSYITAFARDNSIAQNPSYAIRWTANQTTARGEVNDNRFKSYGVIAQHSQRFKFLQSRLLAGATFDYSPTDYYAHFLFLDAQLRPDGKSVEKFTIRQERPDSFLVKYDAILRNTAAYAQLDFVPLPKVRVSLGGRYDQLSFNFTNFLDNKSGSKSYGKFTPKVGITYEIKQNMGIYANYSQGFSPPGLTAIFRKRPTPAANGDEFYYNLEPAQFDNMEFGGWAAFWQNKIYVDFAIYNLIGRNELLNIRQPDNSFDYQSAGKTLHRGVEFGLTAKPTKEFFFRLGGAYSLHTFESFELSQRPNDVIKNVDGKTMPGAPRWLLNTELSYYPKWLPNFRTSLEWQRLSPWYQDQVNNVRYEDKGALGLPGVSVFNYRIGYKLKGVELFVNILNLTDELYAFNATRNNGATDRSTFTPAAPRTFTWGIQYNFTGKSVQQ
jgi:iron complex outermembrane recepter protein